MIYNNKKKVEFGANRCATRGTSLIVWCKILSIYRAHQKHDLNTFRLCFLLTLISRISQTTRPTITYTNEINFVWCGSSFINLSYISKNQNKP